MPMSSTTIDGAEARVAEYIERLGELITAREGYAPTFTWVDIPIHRTDGAHYLTPVRILADGTPIGHGCEAAAAVTTTEAQADPNEAFWNFTQHLRTVITREVLNAHHRVRAEIHHTLGTYHHRWVDDAAIDQIVDQMTLTTTTPRIIERQTSDQPLGVNHYTDAIATIRRDANDAVARAIGDSPRRGYQIRKLAHEQGTTDPAAIHKHLTSQGNSVRLDTVERALNPMPTADAIAEPIEATDA